MGHEFLYCWLEPYHTGHRNLLCPVLSTYYKVSASRLSAQSWLNKSAEHILSTNTPLAICPETSTFCRHFGRAACGHNAFRGHIVTFGCEHDINIPYLSGWILKPHVWVSGWTNLLKVSTTCSLSAPNCYKVSADHNGSTPKSYIIQQHTCTHKTH